MKVLITSGGGAKGAFSVGVLQYLLGNNVVDKFDLISGTSTGSLIAAMIGANKLDTLTDVYLNTTNANVLAPQNVVDSIMQSHPYIYDTEPLLLQLKTNITQASYDIISQSATTLCFNSVCLQTGRVTVFSTKDINSAMQYDKILITDWNSMIQAMLASSNQAVFMNPVPIGGKEYVDGGNREVIPTRVVINNLPNTEDHDIYVLSNNPDNIVEKDDFGDILKVLMRSIAVFIQEVRENDLEVLATYKKISPSKVRIFYIRPPEDLDPEFSTGLRFDKVRMQKWMNAGTRIAKQVMKAPLGNFPLS